MSLYLGLDCSTQSLSAVVLRVGQGRATVVFEHSLEFDRDVPHYGTQHGVLASSEPRVQVSPPGMWAEALDLVLGTVAGAGLDVGDLRAIAGSAQQHGSVYLGTGASDVLSGLDASRPLAGQLAGAFSRAISPIWMDTSTSAECREIADALGGPSALARLTGSRAFERFTGPQIRRFWKTDPARYDATTRVHLVSSFLASLLLGNHAPLDPGDASGMNLMDISASVWAPAAVAATAPGLGAKLPPIVPSSTVIGTLSPYWQRRHRLPAARLAAWTGDNPSSLIGTGLVHEGLLAISLGTSDTAFGLMASPRVDVGGTGHVFGSPTGDFMGLTCFRNGSLARERVRDAYGLDWEGFAAALAAAPPGNDGALMLPWFEPEITPLVVKPGVRRHALEPDDVPRNVRAVVEAQMVALANHSRWMGVQVDTIHATGGASANAAILQVMADVFEADVYAFESSNSACLGAALRAWHTDAAASSAPVSWQEIVEAVVLPARGAAIRPRTECAETYRNLRERHAEFERRCL